MSRPKESKGYRRHCYVIINLLYSRFHEIVSSVDSLTRDVNNPHAHLSGILAKLKQPAKETDG